MKEIKCPKCGTVFTIDEGSYNEILEQVRKNHLDEELEKTKKAVEEKYIAILESEKTKLLSETKDKEKAKDDKINELLHKVELLEKSSQDEVAKALSKKDVEIAELKGKITNAQNEAALKVNEAIAKERKVQEELRLEKQKLEGDLANKEKQHLIEMNAKDEEVKFYKDFKAKQSTKIIGESLEVYCHNEFDKIRAIAYPRAYFEKDNDVVEGTKGDFVFRDYDENNTEFLSIMFEMKNENDETASKHKNEDFFKKLDDDRKKKGCEYAVLVSMLEPDSDLYNNGIVDVSYRYPNMYVVRPQFFLPIIALLDAASKKNSHALALIEEEKQRNIDVTNFEAKLGEFQSAFERNYDLAAKQFGDAIDEIDKTIKHLENVKEDLLKSRKNLKLANDKAQDLSIKKLTKDSPSLKAKFEAIDTEEK
ncbi:MAG: DUF2130 domain-containing protein [Bacilli bacterium]|nr:DUF2130 domain-containing protein [Bacilli bacterium]